MSTNRSREHLLGLYNRLIASRDRLATLPVVHWMVKQRLQRNIEQIMALLTTNPMWLNDEQIRAIENRASWWEHYLDRRVRAGMDEGERELFRQFPKPPPGLSEGYGSATRTSGTIGDEDIATLVGLVV